MKNFPALTGFACAVVVCVISSNQCAGAQQLVQHRFVSDNPQSQLEDILYLSAGVELTKFGLSSTREDATGDFVLNTTYKEMDSSIDLTYELFLTSDLQSPVGHVQIIANLNYDIDLQVGEAIRRTLEDAGIEPVDNPKAQIFGLLPDAPGPKNGDTSEAPLSSDTAKVEVPGQAQDPDHTENTATVPAKFDVSLLPSLLVFFGDLTEFFHYGGGGVLTLGPSWQGKDLRFAFGLRASFFKVFNDPGVSGGDLYLGSAGLRFAFGSGASTPYSITASANGGVTMITLVRSGVALNKAVPMAGAGISFDFPLGPVLFLGGSVDFTVVFDATTLIMAASPALSLRLEF